MASEVYIMLCTGNLCPAKYEGGKIYERSFYDIDEDEFIKTLKHEKCKIIKLIRRQMNELQNPQYMSLLRSKRRQGGIATSTLLMGSSTPTRQAWCLRTLGKIRQRICMVVLILGIVALIASIYSIYFHSYLCNNGKSCVTTLRYTHAKHTLF